MNQLVQSSWKSSDISNGIIPVVQIRKRRSRKVKSSANKEWGPDRSDFTAHTVLTAISSRQEGLQRLVET